MEEDQRTAERRRELFIEQEKLQQSKAKLDKLSADLNTGAWVDAEAAAANANGVIFVDENEQMEFGRMARAETMAETPELGAGLEDQV